MPAGPEIIEYRGRVDASVEHLRTLREKTEQFAVVVSAAADAVDVVDKTGDVAEKVREAVDNQLTVLKVTKQAGPLKIPSKAFEKILKAVRPVAKKIEDSVKKLNGFQDNDGNSDDPGEFLDKLEAVLNISATSLSTIADGLAEKEKSLIDLSETMGEYTKLLNVATTAPYASSFAGLNAVVEAQLGARNDAAEQLETAYNSIVDKIEGILAIVNDAKLDIAIAGSIKLDGIEGFFDVISKPLSIAAAIIKPIEPILDAVGFLVDLVLGPVFDFISSTLGIDKLLDSIAKKITDQLPGANIFEDFVAQAQAMIDDLRDFVNNSFGLDAFIDNIEASYFGTAVGNAQLGPTGFGTDSNDTINGDSGDDILDGREGDDTINGGGGNDAFVASEGDDVLDGGDGIDLIYFDGLFSEYELSRASSNGPVTITHVNPVSGGKNEGSETISNIEHVVFKNISFTGAQLENAIIGGSTLNGTDADELLFLNTSGTKNSDGQHVANGMGGDDRIFGTNSENESDELNGGTGNDTFVPGLGDDEVNGDSGSDTLHILSNGANSTTRVNLTDGFALSYEGNDTLSSIENAVIKNSGDHQLTGNADNNSLISATGDDVVTGGAGDDILNTGAGKDFLFGGDGVDRLFAGADNDFLTVGGAAVAGQGEYYDGGTGTDSLSYSQDRNAIYDIRRPELSIQSAVKAALDNTTSASGAVRIFAETGTIERLDANGDVEATDTAVGIENFQGSDLSDIIYGTAGSFGNPTLVHGAGGDDVIYSNGSNSTYGGAGDDTLYATLAKSGSQTGSSIFDGGDGHDFLDLSPVGDVSWEFRLVGSIARQINALGPDGSSKYFANIYNVEEFILGDRNDKVVYAPGGSNTIGKFHAGDGNDFLDADGGYAIFLGGDGEDVADYITNGEFYGGNGNDRVRFDTTAQNVLIDGGADADFAELKRFNGTADGGTGFDTVAFSPIHNSFVEVDLTAGTMKSTGMSNGSTVTQIDATLTGFEEVIGTLFNDKLKGSESVDQLLGRDGADEIDGRGGDDKLYGGTGVDDINGGAGNDLLHGGAGNDTLDGGEGNDTASYAYAAPGTFEGELVAANFGGVTGSISTGTVTGSHGSDTLISIENIYGSAGDDNLSGDSQTNILSGERGDDQLFGLGGDDYLITGAGTDTASGGDGDDTFIIGTGNKTISGGSGTDTLDFGTVSGTVNIDFTAQRYDATFTEFLPVWADTQTTEARTFSGVALTPQMVLEADPFFSNSADDLTRVLPGDGHEKEEEFRIVDKAFDVGSTGTFSSVEQVIGGVAGSNLLVNSSVNRFNGDNSDADFIDLSNSAVSITYNFATGVSNSSLLTNDVLSGVEGIRSGVADDNLMGNAGINLFAAGAGSDVLNGAGGEDTVILEGSAAWNVNFLDGTASNGTDTDTLISIENAVGSSGNDRMFGDSASNKLEGGAGNDTLVGNADILAQTTDILDGGDGDDIFYAEFKDTIIGGAGRDVLYQVNDYAMTIDLGATSIEYMQGGFNGDTIDASTQTTGVEVYSGGGDDIVIGSDFNDFLFVGIGNDTADGGGGNDVILGDIGADRLEGGSGDDSIYVDAQDTLFDGGTGFDALYIGGSVGLTVDMAATKFEWVRGSTVGGDTIDASNQKVGVNVYAAGGNDSATGSGFADFLWGEDGNDILIGNAGDDVLVGGDGADTMTGGTGFDVLFANAGGGADGDVDTFVMTTNWGTDILFDFENGTDKIDMTALNTSFAALTITTEGAHAHIRLGSELISVADSAGDIEASDFIF